MAANSSIEWTDTTWNPVTGCTRASEGCDNCYAVTMTKRLAAMGQEKYQGLVGNGHFNGVIKTHYDELQKPLRWKKPRMVFVNSMSDLFHKDVPTGFIVDVFAAMYECQRHTFQVLTKRAERLSLLNNPRFPWAVGCVAWANALDRDPRKRGVLDREDVIRDVMDMWPLPNVWVGVSCESQEQANARHSHLAGVSAAVRFWSAEPLLGPIDCWQAWRNSAIPDWVIVGGESGRNARPMNPGWVSSIRDQCSDAGVPLFFKQWGEWTSNPAMLTKKGSYHTHEWGSEFGPPVRSFRVGKKQAGRLLDGREWSEFPSTHLIEQEAAENAEETR